MMQQYTLLPFVTVYTCSLADCTLHVYHVL